MENIERDRAACAGCAAYLKGCSIITDTLVDEDGECRDYRPGTNYNIGGYYG